MKIGLVGPGAVGCVLAGALVQRREIDLVIGARSSFDRLVVTGTDLAVDIPARVYVEPPPLGGLEIVVVATKAHQTASAGRWLDAWVDARTVVLVAQNDVEQAEAVRSLAPTARVVPAVVSCPSRRHGPGHAELKGSAELVVPDDELGRAVAGLFEGTFVRVVLTSDWVTAAWKKLLFNSAAGAITTLARRSNAILRDAEARALALALMHETAAVARAEQADVPPALVEEILDHYLARAGNHTASITADRIAGIPTEWQARNAVVVRKAARHGIAVPLNTALTTLLRLSEP